MRRACAATLACALLAGCATAPAERVARPVVAAAEALTHDHVDARDPSNSHFAMGPCVPAAPPVGAIPPSPPAWCEALRAGVATAVSGANSWVDTFDSGLEHTAFPPGYRVIETARPSTIYRTKHFAHNGHWMVDVAGSGTPLNEYEGDRRDDSNWGGAMVRPDRTFRFENGKLAIEFDVAAGMLAYEDGWPEVIVTPAAATTGAEVDPDHAIGLFGGAASVGCRLYTDRLANCSAYDSTDPTDPSGRPLDAGLRIFELSAEHSEGAAVAFGGAPRTPALAAAWRLCGKADPDTLCRDRWRLELGSDSVRLFVNGTLYMQHSGLPPAKRLPREILTGDVYVYFASWAYLGKPSTLRFHWGRLAINPG